MADGGLAPPGQSSVPTTWLLYKELLFIRDVTGDHYMDLVDSQAHDVATCEDAAVNSTSSLQAQACLLCCEWHSRCSQHESGLRSVKL
ncbi:hypothetical protein Y1Q_0019861 [Alligator mississippiensis]|uniref:Uncharacterized protein n=1 Tax=Alligator mississippiensis TaxID=8496 RepID=A0A151PFM5_ALLMI|nr:hypothetical protein Y1Q_0019861 [Alligator mississippiensis]